MIKNLWIFVFFSRPLSFLTLFICLTASSLHVVAVPLNVNVQSEAAILYNPDNGRILYEKSSNDPYYPASITKVVTAIWAIKLKGNKLEELVTVSGESLLSVTEEAKRQSNYTLSSWYLVPGTSNMGLKKGEIIPFQDLLYGLMVSSAGDSANVIAEHAAGTIPQFIKGMNQWVKSIGCKNTHFENPHGLFHPDQKTTAADMALIMKEALKDPLFRKLISTVSYTRAKTNKNPASTLVQTNRMLRPGPFYNSKVIGGKTGYLSLAFNTFVVAAKDKERTLIAVLLKSKERTDLWKDATKLFDTAFNQPKTEIILMKAGLQNATLQDDNFEGPISAFLSEDAKLISYPAEEQKVKGLIYWDTVAPPVQKGARIGELRILDDQNFPLKTYPLYAASSVKGTWSYAIKNYYTAGTWPSLIFKWALTLFLLVSLPKSYFAIRATGPTRRKSS